MTTQKHKKKFKMWSAFSILFLIIAILVFVSWILQWTGATTELNHQQYFQFVDGSWNPIASVPSDYNGIMTTVNNDWWINHSDRDPNIIYLVSNFQETSPIQALGILDIFVAPMKGFMNRVGIIIFILVIGAFVYMIVASKALEGFSQTIVAKMKGKEIWAIIPLMIFFSVSGTTHGMAEESLGFYMVIVPLMIAAGFDTMTGLLIILLGAGAGVLTSTVNPFAITVAVDGLNSGAQNGQLMTAGDGLVWRLVSWAIITALAIGFVMWYAYRIKANPQRSVTFATRDGDRKFFLTNAAERIKMTGRRKATLAVFGISFIFMIIYLVGWDSITGTTVMGDMANAIHQYFPYFNYTVPGFGNGDLEFVASFFLLATIVVGMINTIGIKKEPGQTAEDLIIKNFFLGASDVLGVSIVIATASGIGFVLEETHMQQLIVNLLSNSIGGINSGIGQIIVLYILFLPLSFLIPSTSGFATAVFPLLTGVTQLSNGAFDPVTGSGSITAFTFASGLINLITPTSGVVMGAMALSRVNYLKFLKLVAPFIVLLFIVSILLLAIGGAIGGTIA